MFLRACHIKVALKVPRTALARVLKVSHYALFHPLHSMPSRGRAQRGLAVHEYAGLGFELSHRTHTMPPACHDAVPWWVAGGWPRVHARGSEDEGREALGALAVREAQRAEGLAWYEPVSVVRKRGQAWGE